MRKDLAKLVPIDSICPHPEGQMRTEQPSDKEIQEMADTFNTVGQINPVQIDSDNYIIAGEQRWSAGKIAGFTEIEVQVCYPKDDFERMEMQIVENDRHIPTNDFDRAAHYKRMYDFFMETYEKPEGAGHGSDQGISAMARRLSMHSATLNNFLRLANNSRVTPELRVLGKRIKISASIINNIAALPREQLERMIQRCNAVLDKGGKISRNGGETNSLVAVLRNRPEATEAGLDIFFSPNLAQFEKVAQLKALAKGEKTPEEKAHDALNNVWTACRTIDRAVDRWSRDMTKVPMSIRELFRTRAGRTYRGLDAIFESDPEFQVEEE